ncbi:MAG: peptidoglycan bridge formation glycyltransferase FemA/FemB family protein [Candidatus Kaiserbacteria bacterium]|nr:peptidoglycan bridge formation glycyltransferase FemA/FemB family protein [Candidatus Kaiserbacteria bacterium]
MYIHQPADDFDPDQYFDDVPLHQSLFYRRWKQAYGQKVITLAVSDPSGAVQAFAQCVGYDLPGTGCVWVADHGPIGTFSSPSIESEFYHELRRRCSEASPTSHLRLHRVPPTDRVRSALAEQGPGSFVQPVAERVISIDGDMENITASFSKSTRRQIQKYEQNQQGIRFRVENVDFMSHFADVYDILTQTAQARGFSLHPREYYETVFSELVESPEYGALILGYVDEISVDKPVSAVLVVYTGAEAYHLFVGNMPEGLAYSMPTLTLIRALHEAKNQGIRRYNLGGVEVEGSSSLSSLSEFKQKFGGSVVIYDRPRDIVVSWWRYLLFRFLRFPIILSARRLLTTWYRYTVAELQSTDIGT